MSKNYQLKNKVIQQLCSLQLQRARVGSYREDTKDSEQEIVISTVSRQDAAATKDTRIKKKVNVQQYLDQGTQLSNETL